MTRDARQAQRAAERRFPVRLRVAVPVQGLGGQLALMHAWLDQTCGPDGWTSAPAGLAGIVNDAIAFYFADAAFAQAFVARFCCGYRVEAIGGAFAVRGAALPVRHGTLPHRTP
jgi:hypothetical protein